MQDIHLFFRWSFLYYLPVGILYLSSDEKEGIILKVLFFLALVFLNVSWLSINHITLKNIMTWAKVHYSMKIKKREKMSIINVIMLSLLRKCLVALLRVFVVFFIFSLWFKGNSSNILDAGLFLWYFFGLFSILFLPFKIIKLILINIYFYLILFYFM